MMNDVIKELVLIIREEESRLEEFLDHLESQKEILIKNDTEAFERSVMLQENLISEIKKLEETRIEKVRALARGMAIEESEITLTRLVEMSLGNVSSELKDVKKNVNGLVNRIRRVNQINQYLIKRSLNRAQQSIDWLIDGANMDVTYQSNGHLRNRNLQSIVVNKTY